jgi:hypothetical protein
MAHLRALLDVDALTSFPVRYLEISQWLFQD